MILPAPPAFLPLVALLGIALATSQLPEVAGDPSSPPPRLRSPDEPLSLHFHTAPHTSCLDGSPSGFYFRPAATAASARKFVFYLEGGGLCQNPQDCLNRTRTTLGSSTNWPSSWTDPTGLLTSNSSVSDFATYNHVWLRYCSGDCWTGQRPQPNAYGLVFTGHQQVIETLLHFNRTNQLFTQAEEVLWSGDSAGAIGALNTANLVQSMLSPHTHLRIVSEAGFFVPGASVAYAEWAHGIELPYQDVATLYFDTTFGSYVDERCAAIHRALGKPTFLCLSASVLYPHIRPPVFLLQNIFDSVILPILGWTESVPGAEKFMADFGEAMVQDVWYGTMGHTKDAVLLSSCIAHCNNLCPASYTRVNGYSYRDMLRDWYFGTNRLSHRQIDDCYFTSRLPCNPTCKGIDQGNCVIMGNGSEIMLHAPGLQPWLAN